VLALREIVQEQIEGVVDQAGVSIHHEMEHVSDKTVLRAVLEIKNWHRYSFIYQFVCPLCCI
jgi:hypothetical protein